MASPVVMYRFINLSTIIGWDFGVGCLRLRLVDLHMMMMDGSVIFDINLLSS